MNEESREKKKAYEIISKNRLLFAFAGSIIVIIAFFMPTFHTIEYIDMLHVYFERTLWIFGLYEENLQTYFHNIEWFGVYEQTKFPVALISIASTIVMSGFVLGTIFTTTKILIRKKKKREYSTRLLVYFSIGIFIALNIYMYTLQFYTPMGRSNFFVMGPIVFIIGSLFILLGYTVKVKPLLKIVSLFLACGLIFYGAFELVIFLNFLISSLPYLTPSAMPVLMQIISQMVIPATIAIICALVIVLINYRLYRKAKKRATIV